MSKFLLESIFTGPLFFTLRVQNVKIFFYFTEYGFRHSVELSHDIHLGHVRGDVMFIPEHWNVQIWRPSPSGYLAGHKGCCLVTNWVILAHFCWARNYLQLSYEFLRILLILLTTLLILQILLNVYSIRVSNSFSCCVCGSGPTLGTNIVFFANSFVATAGTKTRNATFKIVHTDLL